ncbi:DUF5361 domain-containing protein [Enterococcus cecorum]|uniref:DUF5361 domain-containing protein n=1 Tax=Enterococcus cecorum TaxID=44008 RepID=UPI000643CC6D|nr:DUF5361 domain-containing protein [Enterococcus cecorum]KLO70119.1 hypothetical protein AA988_07335 [Enterococcus cecorum]CAI3366188.1 hypothetical protein CIRMBP1316_00620 [Enterococcus cecorum]
MLKVDEDAIICDLAETYNIYDYRQLPVSKVAVFVCGLRSDSRIMMKISDSKLPLDTLLLAGVADRLSIMLWQNTKDGQRGKNQPVSIVDQLTKQQIEREEVSFESGKDFEAEKARILRGGVVNGD